jgi:hypothetical protein
VKRRRARPLGDERQHDVAAVAVGEALARREGGRVPVEHREIVLGRRQLVDGDRHDVVGDLAAVALVEVVPDPRPVAQQMLDGDVVADHRKVRAEDRADAGA